MKQLIALIIDESKWLPLSMSIAFLASIVLLLRHRALQVPGRRRVLAVMNLFFGVTILTMAFGHLLAVTTKLVIGRLQGSTLKFYAIGIALVVPTLWLVFHTRQILNSQVDHGRTTLLLNGWIALTLLVLGIHNLPIAAPAFINIGLSHTPTKDWLDG